MQAYIRRVNSTNTITTAMVENCFKDALQEATAVDKMLEGDYSIEELKVSESDLIELTKGFLKFRKFNGRLIFFFCRKISLILEFHLQRRRPSNARE